MAKLNQVLALEKGAKSAAFAKLTALHRQVQVPALISGISRTYQPKDDEGETLPPESTRVQVTVEQTLKQVTEAMVGLFDITASKDWANATARADVKVNGTVLLADVPVTYLLFLEKQLTDLRTFVDKLPVLDAAETWSTGSAMDDGVYRNQENRTTRTKKVPRNHVKAPATDKHPAQVEVYFEDVTVGHWTTIKFSGATPATRVAGLKSRIEALHNGVKVAREEANGADAVRVNIGETIFSYILG